MDDDNRLTGLTYPGGSVSYDYDAADQLTSDGTNSYTYDANGNQIAKSALGDSRNFTYDHENRLTQSVVGGVTSTSVYNGDGLRMSHTVSGVTTSYVWDVAAGLPVVLQDGTNTYVYGLDLISATDGAGVQTYFTYDGLGSTTDLTDGSGNVTDTYAYGVFGGLRSGTPGATDWLFTGEQRDADRGLYYLRARYYDPEIGRFLGRDAVAANHPYAYAQNNPTNFTDPSGKNPCGIAVTATVVVSATTGAQTAGTTVVVTSTGAAAVCAGTALVAVCELADGGCISSALGAAGDLGGAAGGAIAEGAGAAAEGVGDVAKGVWGGITSRFSKGDNPYHPKYHENPPLTGIGHEFKRPTPWKFPPPDCFKVARAWRKVCWAGVLGALSSTVGYGVSVIFGEKPPVPRPYYTP